jgi:carboxypeptidase family protein
MVLGLQWAANMIRNRSSFLSLLLGLSLVLHASAADLVTCRVSVAVRDEKGNPVREGSYSPLTERAKNAPDLMDKYQGMLPSWSSDDGRFEFPVTEPGKVTLKVHAPGYLPREVDFDAPEGGGEVRLEVVLKAGPATLVGQLTGPTGQPLPGILVDIVIKNWEPNRVLPDIRLPVTDSDGRFRIQGLTEDVWTVRIQGSGYLPVIKDLKPHAGENRLDLRLERGLEVTGRIVDLAGRPVPDASPGLEPKDLLQNYSDHVFMGDASDGDGYFLISGVSAGRYRLQIRKQGYLDGVSIPVVLTDRSVRGIEVRLDPGGILHGRIHGLSAKDLAEVKIYPEPHVPVDSHGEFQIRGLKPGDWAVIAQSGARRVEVKGTLTESSGEANFDLEFPPGVPLSGQVLRAGKPVRNGMAEILSGPPGASAWSRAELDDRGEFHFGDLPPGIYRIAIFGSATHTLLHEGEIELRDASRLQIELRTGNVSGRVVLADTGSQPVAWAYVDLWRPRVLEGSYPIGAASAVSDAKGKFTIEDVAPGSYSISVKKEGYKPAEATLQVEEGGTAEIQITMQSTAARPVCVPATPIKP